MANESFASGIFTFGAKDKKLADTFVKLTNALLGDTSKRPPHDVDCVAYDTTIPGHLKKASNAFEAQFSATGRWMDHGQSTKIHYLG